MFGPHVAASPRKSAERRKKIEWAKKVCEEAPKSKQSVGMLRH